jgi:tryptophanyl-tRNA synthetase
MRAHAFKDHEAKNKEVNIGLFDYPVLMAADILMYQADIVPVGSDQKQHVEYARDISERYNRVWGPHFKLPRDFILDDVATIPGVDGQKMSKSRGNVISLFASDEEVKKSVMGIVTDSKAPDEKKDPDTNNIYNIHKLFLNEEENASLRAKFENGGYGYKDAKEDLLVTIMKWREGKKEVYDDLIAHPEKIMDVLKDGGEKARTRAGETMKVVRAQVGFE